MFPLWKTLGSRVQRRPQVTAIAGLGGGGAGLGAGKEINHIKIYYLTSDVNPLVCGCLKFINLDILQIFAFEGLATCAR